MGICFVMQPFDNGIFDKRYEDTFAPAIKAADLEPYRVDRDPCVSVPIEDIQSGIRKSEVCLAEITTDNPNVWFELGYAIASQKEVVLVCSEERKTKFPFDIQHRTITLYTTDSARDFDVLSKKITERLRAIIKKGEMLGRVADMPSPPVDEDSLAQHELVTLVTIAENLNNPSDRISTYTIRDDMDKAGFPKIAVTLGLIALLKKGMVDVFEDGDWNNNSCSMYSLTKGGMDWLMKNQDRLILQQRRSPTQEADKTAPF